MKKAMCIFCILCSLLCVFGHANESHIYSSETKIEKLRRYNIINGYENGQFCPQKNITRAEFCKMVAAMLELNEENTINSNGVFEDVPSDHWASKYITACYSQKLIKGVLSKAQIDYSRDNELSDTDVLNKEKTTEQKNLFLPDDDIIFLDALKILVCALGYEEFALHRGGYPMGYITTAQKMPVISIEFSGEDCITRETAAEVIYDSLFVPLIIQREFSDGNGDRVELIIANGENDTPLQTIYSEHFQKYE